MVLDTSALLAILLDEPKRRAFNEAIETADSRGMSVATLAELSIVSESRFGRLQVTFGWRQVSE